jgi:hypothetical protein
MILTAKRLRQQFPALIAPPTKLGLELPSKFTWGHLILSIELTMSDSIQEIGGARVRKGLIPMNFSKPFASLTL